MVQVTMYNKKKKQTEYLYIDSYIYYDEYEEVDEWE